MKIGYRAAFQRAEIRRFEGLKGQFGVFFGAMQGLNQTDNQTNERKSLIKCLECLIEPSKRLIKPRPE
jgi:hypothetical protein